jgi:putative aldouronate transport system permease protein
VISIRRNNRKKRLFNKEFRKQLKKYRTLYILLLPVIAFYVLFCYVPMYGIILAFKDYNVFDGIVGSDWAGNYGFEHFLAFLKDKQFWKVTRNTLIISLLKLIIGFPIPIILALLMNEMMSMKFKRGIQTIIYLPRFISWVIVGGMVFATLSPNGGLLNSVLMKYFNLDEPIYFMIERNYARGIVVFSDIWKNAGWNTIIYMAALSTVNPELYEAADIDGAGRFSKMRHISLASIRPTIVMLFILALAGILNAGFDQIFVIYNSMIYEKIDIIDTYVYRQGIVNGNYSYATAVGLFKSIIGLALIIAADKYFKWRGDRGII